MTIIELAKQAGFQDADWNYIKALAKFAELVEAAARADEREKCAKLCDEMNSMSDYYGLRIELICAQAIRARGTT